MQRSGEPSESEPRAEDQGAELPPWEKDLRACIAVLEAIAADRTLMMAVTPELRRQLVMAAGRVAKPDRATLKAMAKAMRRKDHSERERADAVLLEATEMRRQKRRPFFSLPAPSPTTKEAPREAPQGELRTPRKCYVCKAEFRHLHFFYDQLCAPCAELNHSKRTQSADLGGRVALVTGARLKIGYQAAILLLRSGARVIVTTRFPHEAAQRYAKEPDFEAWRDRLVVHGLDLMHTPSVERFCDHLLVAEPRLDYIINNAAQTVRRPPAFYAHLREVEAKALSALPEAAKTTIGDGFLPERPAALASASEESSQFPKGMLDRDLQQVDLRTMNSWRLTLGDVPTIELLEVHLVNAIAPFVLNSRLKPLLLKERTMDKHIVNVSAMEAQFARAHKTDKHPHTNMAKAALNMMTRTSAVDYAADGIFMNSVDTGWVTDEDPMHLSVMKTEVHGFHPPLDAVDGAARVVDPIFTGVRTGEHVYGLFLKDYRPAPW